MTSDRLLIVDDDPGVCDFIRDVAEGLGYAVIASGSAAGVVSGLRSFDPDVLFLDLQMPEIDGVEVIRRLADQRCDARIVLASGEDPRVLRSARKLAESHGLKVATTLRKPVRLEDLESLLNKLRSGAPPLAGRDLRRAIAEGELVVQYQPKVKLCDGGGWRVHSVEALARWNHPQLGLLGPDTFIALAEQNDLISALTDHVLGFVVDRLGDWHRRGTAIPVAVNLSPRLLGDLETPDHLSHLVEDAGIDGKDIIFEVTETSAMTDVGRAMDVLTRLRLKGFKLSVDDFGTGFSSLIHLYRMPFSELKIDKEFVLGLPADEESATIVKAIVNLGHDLGLEVCVEGVETRDALTHLQSFHCDLYQGYYFSPPLPERELGSLIGRQLGETAAAPGALRADGTS